jgi:hypothetical protein
MVQKAQDVKEVKVEFPKELKGGAYCNILRITHTREEFIMDFMMITPPIGAVVSRVIMSPGHMKRTISALQSNLKKYEKSFGALKEATEPIEERRIGFKTH